MYGRCSCTVDKGMFSIVYIVLLYSCMLYTLCATICYMLYILCATIQQLCEELIAVSRIQLYKHSFGIWRVRNDYFRLQNTWVCVFFEGLWLWSSEQTLDCVNRNNYWTLPNNSGRTHSWRGFSLLSSSSVAPMTWCSGLAAPSVGRGGDAWQCCTDTVGHITITLLLGGLVYVFMADSIAITIYIYIDVVILRGINQPILLFS